MNTTRFARSLALPIVSAGIIGGAALGLAGMANAGTYPTHDPSPRPGIVATPNAIARPPAVVIPGHHWHKDRGLIIDVSGGE
jgi:hypothetical protein